ncbi:MAG TPA: CpaF family protein [Tepidisphaeraceae bacterium]|nr:CpaF family protein [Tepidisphaeraceae bacterium]
MGLFSRNNGNAAVATPPPVAPAPAGGLGLGTGATPAPAAAATSLGLAAATISAPRPAPAVSVTSVSAPRGEREIYLEKMKVRIHQQLVDRLDVTNLKALPPETVRLEVRALIRELCQSEKGLLNTADQERLMDEVMDETFGLGPLETLLKDPTISDILVNRWDRIYVERRGRIELSDIRFRDNQHLRQIIDRIVAIVGRRIDEVSPMADARLADGSRVNAIIPPLALDGPAMSIRRFGSKPLQLEDLIRAGAFPPAVMDFLAAAVQARCNVIISGGTGSGKTTLLNCLSKFIPADERVITIEDAAELQLQQPHVVRLETRPANIEGKGEVAQRDLVKNCLRMRPDRVIIGECRAGETLDMLQAMNTGHEGSMTTVHANSPRDAMARLEVMVSMSGFDIPMRALRQQICSAINIIVQANRLTGGKRKVTRVTEITGMEGEQVQLQDIFTYEQTGMDENGMAKGHFTVTGIRPKCLDRIVARGIALPGDLFLRRTIDV